MTKWAKKVLKHWPKNVMGKLTLKLVQFKLKKESDIVEVKRASRGPAP
jgi:hypothetical protein